MRWSWSLGRVFGIDVRIHASFLLLVPYIAWRSVRSGVGMAGFVGSSLLVALLFVIVVLHELGHALAARRFGVGTRDIVLLPIGGVARLERMPERPSEELMVALAGPAVNFVLALVLIPLTHALYGEAGFSVETLQSGALLPTMAVVNAMLGLFNLLPAFPLDGGRALRALLSMVISPVKATRFAAAVGKVMGAGLVFLGLVGNIFLVFIGVFVIFGAEAEKMSSELAAATAGLTVGDVVIRDVIVAAPQLSIAASAELLMTCFQREMPVVVGGRLLGLVHRNELLEAASVHGPDSPIGAALTRLPVTLEATVPVSDALSAFSGASAIGVVDQGRFIGLLTADNLMPLARLRAITAETTPAQRGRASRR